MKNEIQEIREQLNIPEGTIIESVQQQINYYKAVRELAALTFDQEVFNAIKGGSLLESEMHAGLCLVTWQFRKAKKILEKYQIRI